MAARFVASTAALLLLVSLQPRSAIAQDSGQVRSLAATCSNCHGTDGRTLGNIPSLAGLSKAYFVEQMRAFKAGTRPATVMQQLAKGYTDEQFDTLAAYFAARPK